MSTDDAAGGRAREPGRVIGDPTKGCRHCGSVERSQIDSVTVYRPSAECCPGAVLDRIERRSDELKSLRRYFDAHETPSAQRQLLESMEDLDRLRAKLRSMESEDA